MSNNTEWLIEFKDNSYFRLSENQFYIQNQKNYEVCRDNYKEYYGGMKEIDFCYCNDSCIDLIECKEVNNINKSNLKDDLRLKALHSSALLKTALYDGKNKIIIPDVVKEIENIIKRSLICPLGKLWNIKEVQVLDYETAKKKLQYII